MYVRDLVKRSKAHGYLQPDDVVETRVEGVSGARLVLGQDVWRGSELLFRSVVTLVALTSAGKPARLPADIRRALV